VSFAARRAETETKLRHGSHLRRPQVFIIENDDPPDEIRASAKLEMFAGERGEGRLGFFPPLA